MAPVGHAQVPTPLTLFSSRRVNMFQGLQEAQWEKEEEAAHNRGSPQQGSCSLPALLEPW